MLEAAARAGRAAPVAGVEAESTRGVAPLPRELRLREDFADLVERADIARGVGPRGLADRRLVDHYHVVNLVRSAQRAMSAGRFGRLALGLAQRGVKHVLDQRRLARAR